MSYYIQFPIHHVLMQLKVYEYMKYAYDKKDAFVYVKNKSTRERVPPKYKST